ncbi:MAG: hypothetical protein DMF89_00095 [Acidobacteria bacterium]|nr:MAG: hypothetical protein DMF89_00095 [Acidobacteriota bacterium]
MGREFRRFALLIAGLWVLAIASATLQQAPSKGAPGADKSTATVQDIMATMIGPASKAVFGAVSSEVTPTGTVEKFPRTDAEWAAVRRQALTMVEGANLLLTPGRRFASPANAAKHNEGELPPAEIEVRVSKERLVWNKLAIAFRDAANGAVKAAEARRQQDFGAVSEAIDTACENCHLRYWYPDQETLLKNAPKPK